MKIPAKIRIKARVSYQVVWTECIRDDETTLGLCDPETRMIYLKMGQSETETIKSLIHEVLHAIEAEHDTPIPHRVVYTLEEGIFKMLKLNGLI
jgi:hypothetical protein